ncbi:MAG: ECF-type sigma factor [Pseudomonadota bacterium]
MLDDEVYRELRHIAAGLMTSERPGHTLQATALVNEAWVRMNRRRPAKINDRGHVVAMATIQMRRALLDHARRAGADRRPNKRLRVMLSDDSAALADQSVDDVDLIDLCVALDELEARNEGHCRVFELRFFGGLTVDECAETLDLSPRTVKYYWQFACAWIASRLELIPDP